MALDLFSSRIRRAIWMARILSVDAADLGLRSIGIHWFVHECEGLEEDFVDDAEKG